MKILILALLIGVLDICQSQTLTLAEAETLFSKNRFSGVWDYYQDQLKKDSLNTLLNYKMGICYLNSRSQKYKAIGYLKHALSKNDLGKEKHTLIYKLLGDAYYHISDFDQAIVHYEKYRNILLSRGEGSGDISKEIEMCKMANDLKDLKEITASLTNNKIAAKKNQKNLYAYHESSVSIGQRSSIPISIKKKSKENTPDKSYFEDIQDAGHYIFKRDPKKVDTTENIMETTIATSVDGQIILIYRDENGNGNLYSSYLEGNEWTAPDQLSKNVINRNWEPNEFVSTNGNELYFSSDREGGFGGKDIYKCLKLSNGEWGKAINMGSTINTKYDEEAPYLYPDGTTLFFSSNRNRKLNFFDNYSSNFTDSAGWEIPINVGYPLYKTISKPTIDSGGIQPNLSLKENYLATFISQKKTPVTVLKGIIKEKDGKIPPYVEITISNNTTGEITGIYHPDFKTGKYAFIIPTGKNQNISYEAEGYLFHSENIDLGGDPNIYKLNKIITLQPISNGAKIKLNNVFFEEGKAVLSSASEIELNKLVKFLLSHPTAQIEISANIDKKSDDAFVKLTEAKIQSVINYLTEKGANKKNTLAAIYKSKKKKVKSVDTMPNIKKPEKLEFRIISLNKS